MPPKKIAPPEPYHYSEIDYQRVTYDLQFGHKPDCPFNGSRELIQLKGPYEGTGEKVVDAHRLICKHCEKLELVEYEYNGPGIGPEV